LSNSVSKASTASASFCLAEVRVTAKPSDWNVTTVTLGRRAPKVEKATFWAMLGQVVTEKEASTTWRDEPAAAKLRFGASARQQAAF
jgi:hypothetical protein